MILKEDIMVNEKGQLVILFSPNDYKKRSEEMMRSWGFECYTEDTCTNPNTFIKCSIADSKEMKKKLMETKVIPEKKPKVHKPNPKAIKKKSILKRLNDRKKKK